MPGVVCPFEQLQLQFQRGDGGAQFVSGIGQEMPLQRQRAAQASHQIIDGADQQVKLGRLGSQRYRVQGFDASRRDFSRRQRQRRQSAL